jgi:hypothetical protein
MQYQIEFNKDCSSLLYHIAVLVDISQCIKTTDEKDSQQHHGRLDTTFKEAQQESNCHEGTESCRCGRTSYNGSPNKHINGESLCQRKLLEEEVLWIFADKNTNVENCSKPRVLEREYQRQVQEEATEFMKSLHPGRRGARRS